MNKEELDKLIAIGEGYNLEFKRTINDSLSKEICSFANREGGKILLGVEDSGEISGFNLTNSNSSRIQSYARNMDPAFEVFVEQTENVVVISVPEGTNKPYSVSGRFYLRIGADSQQMNRDEIRDFFQQERLVLFDQQPNEGFDLQKDFDQFKFDNFL